MVCGIVGFSKFPAILRKAYGLISSTDPNLRKSPQNLREKRGTKQVEKSARELSPAGVKEWNDKDVAEATEKRKEENAEYKDLSARFAISAEIRRYEVKKRLCKGKARYVSSQPT